VSWLAGTDSRRSPRRHHHCLYFKLPAEASHWLPATAKNKTIDYTFKQLPDPRSAAASEIYSPGEQEFQKLINK